MAREPEAVVELRRGLGQRLATVRQAAGLTQSQLADAVAYDRSTLAHIERGRGRADERFWQAADEACGAHGVLLAAFHEFEAAKAEHDRQVRQRALVEARARADWFQSRPAPAPAASSSSLDSLRRVVLGRGLDSGQQTSLTDRAATIATREAHRLYQIADYDAAARLLPGLLIQLDGATSRARTTAAAYIVAAKLATKQADAALAWVTADRALRYATEGAHAGLIGAARYQVACTLLRAGHEGDAEQVAVDAADAAGQQTPEVVSVRGALLLLAAILAARQGNRRAALGYVRSARALATQLGVDGNWLWTAFGPTNVAIHEMAVYIDLGDTQRALEFGSTIDTDNLPTVLNGRRSQVHLDLARASARMGDDHLAVLHLLEGERVAAQAISRNEAARSLITELLARERRGITPGLRALATRAEVVR